MVILFVMGDWNRLNMNNNEKLILAFRRGLELDPSVDVETLQYREIPEWDSIGHMALVAEIEDQFDLVLSTEEVVSLSSFTAAKEILTSHKIESLER